MHVGGDARSCYDTADHRVHTAGGADAEVRPSAVWRRGADPVPGSTGVEQAWLFNPGGEIVADRLLDLREISVKLRMPLATVRYKRHRGDLSFTFRLGRRVVAYESEVDDYIASQRAAQGTKPAA